MTIKSSIFEETYKNHLAQVDAIDLVSADKRLRIGLKRDETEVPFFGHPFRVSSKGLFD